MAWVVHSLQERCRYHWFHCIFFSPLLPLLSSILSSHVSFSSSFLAYHMHLRSYDGLLPSKTISCISFFSHLLPFIHPSLSSPLAFFFFFAFFPLSSLLPGHYLPQLIQACLWCLVAFKSILDYWTDQTSPSSLFLLLVFFYSFVLYFSFSNQ